MTKLGPIHFQNSVENHTLMLTNLETAIEVSDASLKLGFARHLLELATDNPNIAVRRSQSLPAATHNIVNSEVRERTAKEQAFQSAQRTEVQQNSAGRVLQHIETE